MQENFSMMMVQSIAGLAAVLAIFAGLVWLLKRLQQQHLPKRMKGESMRIVQRISLDSQHSVVEVSRGNKHYILGLSSGHIQVIEKIDGNDDEPETEEKKDV